MTTVSEIITDAFRQSNLISVNGTLTTNQRTEALRYLNRIVKSVYGNEAGEQLDPVPLGRDNISRPSGFPWYDNVPPAEWFVPKNSVLMLNIDEAVTVYLHPTPDDGTRLGAIDVAGNLATYNVVINGNGRNIEGASSVTLATNGLSTEWFYRQDTGNWYKLATLVASDTFPFPVEFDDLFVSMLALRLNPAYAAEMDQQSMLVLQRARSQFRARYRQTIQMPSELGLLRMPNTTADRYYWAQQGYSYGWYNPTAAFNAGLPY